MWSLFVRLGPIELGLPAGPSGEGGPAHGGFRSHIQPNRANSSVGPNRGKNASVEAWTAGVESFQTVDGGQTRLGVVEGENFPGHRGPVARCGSFQGRFGG